MNDTEARQMGESIMYGEIMRLVAEYCSKIGVIPVLRAVGDAIGIYIGERHKELIGEANFLAVMCRVSHCTIAMFARAEVQDVAQRAEKMRDDLINISRKATTFGSKK